MHTTLLLTLAWSLKKFSSSILGKVMAFFMIFHFHDGMIHTGKHLNSYWPLFRPVFDIQIGNSLTLRLSNAIQFRPQIRKYDILYGVLQNCVTANKV